MDLTNEQPELNERPQYEDGQPCGHKGCLSHVSHPCEGCGRIAGRNINETRPNEGEGVGKTLLGEVDESWIKKNCERKSGIFFRYITHASSERISYTDYLNSDSRIGRRIINKKIVTPLYWTESKNCECRPRDYGIAVMFWHNKEKIEFWAHI